MTLDEFHPMIVKEREASAMFNGLAEITRLLKNAHESRLPWCLDIFRLRAPDGSFVGTNFEDGCIITIVVNPLEQKPFIATANDHEMKDAPLFAVIGAAVGEPSVEIRCNPVAE